MAEGAALCHDDGACADFNWLADYRGPHVDGTWYHCRYPELHSQLWSLDCPDPCRAGRLNAKSYGCLMGSRSLYSSTNIGKQFHNAYGSAAIDKCTSRHDPDSSIIDGPIDGWVGTGTGNAFVGDSNGDDQRAVYLKTIRIRIIDHFFLASLCARVVKSDSPFHVKAVHFPFVFAQVFYDF